MELGIGLWKQHPARSYFTTEEGGQVYCLGGLLRPELVISLKFTFIFDAIENQEKQRKNSPHARFSTPFGDSKAQSKLFIGGANAI